MHDKTPNYQQLCPHCNAVITENKDNICTKCSQHTTRPSLRVPRIKIKELVFKAFFSGVLFLPILATVDCALIYAMLDNQEWMKQAHLVRFIGSVGLSLIILSIYVLIHCIKWFNHKCKEKWHIQKTNVQQARIREVSMADISVDDFKDHRRLTSCITWAETAATYKFSWKIIDPFVSIFSPTVYVRKDIQNEPVESIASFGQGGVKLQCKTFSTYITVINDSTYKRPIDLVLSKCTQPLQVRRTQNIQVGEYVFEGFFTGNNDDIWICNPHPHCYITYQFSSRQDAIQISEMFAIVNIDA